MTRFRAILLPGGIFPAKFAYPDLVTALGADVDARFKELELYETAEPSDDWELDTEIEGVRRFAEEAGFDRFHLVGYSAGGSVALAFCAKHPEHLLSLTLNEPAWGGNEGWDQEERDLWRGIDGIMKLPSEAMMSAFMQSGEPDADLSSQDTEPPPPWFANRPAGLRALHAAFRTYDLDLDSLRAFDRPVMYVTGGKTNPIENEPIVERLGNVFPNFTREIYEERHHFDPPHRAEPERFAASLKRLWERAADIRG